MKISGNIKRGQIYECYLGNYKVLETSSNGTEIFCEDDYDYRIPHEIHKKRLVVIVGNHRDQYLIVPISTKQEYSKNPRKSGESKGYHVLIPSSERPMTHHYKQETDCWAKCNLIQTVDGKRLRNIYCQTQQQYLKLSVSPETLRQIQHGILRVIGLGELLTDLN